MRPSPPDGGTDGAALVTAEVVHHHDIARRERGDEGLLDPGGEALGIDRAVEQAGCLDAVGAQGGEESQPAPVAVRVIAWPGARRAGPSHAGGPCSS